MTKSPNIASDFAVIILFCRYDVNLFLSVKVESGIPLTSKISSDTALYCLSIWLIPISGSFCRLIPALALTPSVVSHQENQRPRPADHSIPRYCAS